MTRRIFTTILVALLAMTSMAVEDIYVTDTIKDLPQDMRLHQMYLEAVCLKNKGSWKEAKNILKKYLESDTTNGAVYMDLANMSYSNGGDTAMTYMAKAAELEPKNYWIQRAYALMLVRSGQLNKAADIYEQLLKDNPQRIEICELLAPIYSSTKQYEKALKQWRHIENESGITPQTTLQKSQIHLDMDNKKKALAEIDTLIASDRTNCMYRVLKASVTEQLGDHKTAEKQYIKIGKECSECYIECQKSLATLYLNTKQSAKCYSAIMMLLADSTGDFEQKRAILVAAIDDEEMSKYFGEKEYETLYMQYSNNENACLLYANYLMSKNDAKALTYVRKALDINPYNTSSWYALIDYYKSSGDDKKYREAVMEASDNNPQNGIFLFQKGSIQMEEGNDSLAIETWKNSTAIMSKDKDNAARASFVSGLVADMYMKKMDKLGSASDKALVDSCIKYYDKALEINPNNIGVMNNYAYLLSVTNGDLNLAEKLSGKTVAAEPTNCSFLDTYAWIYFKMGNYAMAEMYIEQAFDNCEKQSAELHEHYGDISYMRGRETEAMKFWKEADQMFESQGVKREILKKKIEEQKYIPEFD